MPSITTSPKHVKRRKKNTKKVELYFVIIRKAYLSYINVKIARKVRLSRVMLDCHTCLLTFNRR